jgi:hypothetical protein
VLNGEAPMCRAGLVGRQGNRVFPTRYGGHVGTRDPKLAIEIRR